MVPIPIRLTSLCRTLRSGSLYEALGDTVFAVAHRLDIELTSALDDGTFTWRAAGAKKPKGQLNGTLLPDGVGVGDVVKVEAEADLDGLVVTTVFAPKGARKEPDFLEILGSGRDEPLVTQILARGGGRGRDGDDRGRRRGSGGGRGRDGERGGGRGRDGERGERGGRDGGRGGRGDRNRGEGGKGGNRPERRERAKPPARPKAPRLRPGRTHRQAALKALPQAQHQLADEVLRGGVPGVRQAVERMNEKAAAEGMPKIKVQPLVSLAEKMAPTLKAAEWRDRAEAAVAGMKEIDLRDIRSVVAAAENAARDEESRALADQVRAGLTARADSEHRKWLDELAGTIADGRTVRALRLSSRPPKAGAPLPVDMAAKLAEAASASLTAEVTSDRWATVLDAVAFSPVRSQVVAEGIPAKPTAELLTAVKKLASRAPEIAKLFGIEPPAPKGRGRGRRTPPPPPPVAPAAEAAAPAPVVEAPAAPAPEAPAVEVADSEEE